MTRRRGEVCLCIGIGILWAFAFGAMLTWMEEGVRAALGAHDWRRLLEGSLLYGAFGWLMFCVLVNVAANVGAALRNLRRVDDPPLDYPMFYEREAGDDLLLLIPSYREEVGTIWQTMMSAALAEHPRRHVVLLIDDSEEAATTAELMRLLTDARALPARLQARFDAAAEPFALAYDAFKSRLRGDSGLGGELARLTELYHLAADWLDREAQWFADEGTGQLTHTDRCFISVVLRAPAAGWRASAASLVDRCRTLSDLDSEYRRLTSLFRVRFDRFERKRYSNVSHAPNKAMNLNTYLSLVGGSYREETTEGGLALVACERHAATIRVPDAPFVVAIDADSLITHDYNVRLLDVMRRPASERIAIAQSPYTAFPDAPYAIERAASASTDAQFFSHQGLAMFGAATWVGASALMRMAALRDIAVDRQEGGHAVKIFIKDDVLIEDAAATVDLLRKDWHIHHSHLRLSYSATPPDFGSLLIQRRRWANGGLLILPRLLAVVLHRPLSLRTWFDVIIRVPNLTSAATNGLFFSLMLLIPFDDNILPPWIALVMVPSLFMTTLDLVRAGYRAADLFAVQALSVLLVPVNLAGTWQSLRQAATGRQVPFARTPKIAGRTCVPKAYILLLLVFVVYAPGLAVVDFCVGRYSHAAFAALNAAIVIYCLKRFVGLRAALTDLGLIAIFKSWHAPPRGFPSLDPSADVLTESLEGSS